MPAAELPLVFENIQKSFGAVRALRGVNFDLRVGEVHALLGENGAGKSTLIKVAAGAHAPDGGALIVGGERLARLDPAESRARGIACINQQPALFPDLTVAENLALRIEAPGGWRRVDWRARRRRARELLARVGATIAPGAEVRELSMPEQQLVEIACALGTGARVIIMDEPTASLTQTEQEKLFEIVRGLRTAGVGVIYISHRMEEVFALADRVTVLRDGASVGTHPLAELTPATLIKLMVGREMTQLYPPAEKPPGEIVFGLREVGCAVSGVRGVTFDVKAGEVFGLAGLLGAGRTELARVLFGLTPADAGEIRIDGVPIEIRSPAAAIRHGIAYVPEDRRRHGVVLELPVAQNITLAARRRVFPHGWLRAAPEQRMAKDFIERLGIKTAGPQALAATLSGGNQQKVAVARWLATQPRVLILDEPTQGIDVGAKRELHALIRRLAADGLAVIMISSDLPEVLGMSDRIGVMRGGTLAGILPGGASAPEVMALALGQGDKKGVA